ncbi:MAG: STAS domain-containing protein [Treponema sp.]|nr:STAS domain-containing protein [Treponema sp.]
MSIEELKNGEVTELVVSGRLDTATAPQLEKAVKEAVKGIKQLILNLGAIDYISSAGLRVVLVAHKLMAGMSGKLIVKNPSAFCMQVFTATGMNGVLTIQ